MSKLPRSLFVAAATLLANTAYPAATTTGSFYPNDPLFPYNAAALADFPGQWHLVNLAPNVVGASDAGNAGIDVNVKSAWARGITGYTTVIGIIDNGVEGTHEDLAANFRADLSKNFSSNEAIANIAPELQGFPVQADDNHGVAVAGVAAARGGNGVGVTGVAPYAQIAGLRIRLGDDSGADVAATRQDIIDAFLWKSGVDLAGNYTGVTHRWWEQLTYVYDTDGAVIGSNNDYIGVKNNSWGSGIPFYDVDATAGTNNTFSRASDTYKALTAAAANNVISVFAAGDWGGGAEVTDNVGAEAVNQAEVVITVSAIGSDGKFAPYSSRGAAVFVAAPSSGASGTFAITTTDREGSASGYNTYDAATATTDLLADLPDANYTATFSGNSAAAPLVAGIIALGKQVAPAMDTRLAKHALVRSARPIDRGDTSLVATGGRGWVKNAAGYYFNNNYGFGLVDASGFVSTVERAAYVTERTTFEIATTTVNQVIAYGDAGTVQKFTVPAALATQPLETIELRVKVTGIDTWQHLRLDITHDDTGTTSDVILFSNVLSNLPAEYADTAEQLAAAYNEYIPGFDWTFTVNAFWGESAAGDWTLRANTRSGAEITWDNYSVVFNMGDIVFEDDAARLRIDAGQTVKALSLNLDYAGTAFTVAEGGAFLVSDSVNVYGGSVDVAGTLGETGVTLEYGAGAANPVFNKGSQIYVGEKGTFLVRETGTVTAGRGIIVNGGVFDNRGTLDIGGEITVANGGQFFSSRDISFGGDVVVAGGSFEINTATTGAATGNLTLSGYGSARITAAGGALTVPETLTLASGSLTLEGGSLSAKDILLVGGKVQLSGAAILRAETLSAAAGGIVMENGGALNVTGDINLRSGGIAQSFQLGGATVAGTAINYSLYSPGGFTKIRLATDPVTGAVGHSPVRLDGNLVMGDTGVFWVDAKMVAQPDGTETLVSDVLTVSGNVTLAGILYINPLNVITTVAGEAGRVLLLQLEDPLLEVAGEFDMTRSNTAITPTLHYNVVKEGSFVYGEPTPDYAWETGANRFTPNQRRIGRMFNALYTKLHPDVSVTLPGSPATVNVPAATRAAADVFIPSIGTAEEIEDVLDPEYDYGAIFAALDTAPTFSALASLYDQLAPTNSLILGETLRQQLRAPVSALRSRSREARSGFIQPGALWTNPLFGDSVGFNFNSYNGRNDETPVTLWANGGGSYAPGKKNETTRGYDTYGYSVTLGIDYRFNPCFLIGALAGISGTETDFNTSGLRNSGDSIFFGVYAAGSAGGWFYNGMVAGSADSYSLKRDITAVSAAAGHFKGKPSGSTFFANFETGWEWRHEGWAFGPIAGIQYSRSDINAYTESGDAEAWQRLRVGKQKIDSLTSSLGFRISKVFHFSSISILPEIRASWLHEFEDGQRKVHATFNIPNEGAWGATLDASKTARDYFNGSAAFTFLLRENIPFSLEYDVFAFQSNPPPPPQHQISATLRVSF